MLVHTEAFGQVDEDRLAIVQIRDSCSEVSSIWPNASRTEREHALNVANAPKARFNQMPKGISEPSTCFRYVGIGMNPKSRCGSVGSASSKGWPLLEELLRESVE